MKWAIYKCKDSLAYDTAYISFAYELTKGLVNDL